MTQRYFVGIAPKLEKIVFRSSEVPTSNTHGKIYSAVIGPFKTKRAAVFMANCHNNPHCRSVSDAERISKELASVTP